MTDALPLVLDASTILPIGLLGGLSLIAWALGGGTARRRSKRHWPRSQRTSPVVVPMARSADAVEQLRVVMSATFTRKRLLSSTEAKVMAAAEAAIAQAGLPWRVLAQVALGEVLASSDAAAFSAINAKRVDLLIVSARSDPIAAIEYQGEGHWQGTAPARDAVKKEALRRAGVGYIEMTPRHGPEDMHREIARLASAQTVGAAALAR